MFSPSFSVFLRYYKTSSHHVVCLAIADWPANTLDGVVITIFFYSNDIDPNFRGNMLGEIAW